MNVFLTQLQSFANFHHFISVLGEPTFQHLADVDTPSGYSSSLEPTELQLSNESLAISQPVMSSTIVGNYTLTVDEPELSKIPEDLHFCPKCGDIMQS